MNSNVFILAELIIVGLFRRSLDTAHIHSLTRFGMRYDWHVYAMSSRFSIHVLVPLMWTYSCVPKI